MQYTEIFFFSCKNWKFHQKNVDIFLIFAQNIDCGYTLEPPRWVVRRFLTSTHNLCFGAKIRKIGIPLHTPVLLYKSGVQGGSHCRDMFSWCDQLTHIWQIDFLIIINWVSTLSFLGVLGVIYLIFRLKSSNQTEYAHKGRHVLRCHIWGYLFAYVP